MDYSSRPLLAFWETTRVCQLSCLHCRASAIRDPLPGELTGNEALGLIDQVVLFGRPYPIMIFTGGDPLQRSGLFDILAHASSLGVPFALSPAVTHLLTDDALREIRRLGAHSISLSLDGAYPQTHDAIRGVKGTYHRTIEKILEAESLGLGVQVNTVMMRRNFNELAQIFHLIRKMGVKTWEVFFLVRVGRGLGVDDLTSEECESVCNFLYDASQYGMTIRCVEAPFIRRVALQRRESRDYWSRPDYLRLRSELLSLEGGTSGPSTISLRGTLDGDGTIFIGYDGTVYPGGLLPFRIGSVREASLPAIYQNSGVLRDIRQRRLNGVCGTCNFREVCGGSRARPYSYDGDPLGSDPACILVEKNLSSLPT